MEHELGPGQSNPPREFSSLMFRMPPLWGVGAKPVGLERHFSPAFTSFGRRPSRFRSNFHLPGIRFVGSLNPHMIFAHIMRAVDQEDKLRRARADFLWASRRQRSSLVAKWLEPGISPAKKLLPEGRVYYQPLAVSVSVR